MVGRLVSNYFVLNINIKNRKKMIAEFKFIAGGIATTALGGVAIGIGQVFSSLVSAVATNPGATKVCFGYAILGFALTEAIALFTIMIVFLILY